jgi:excisionase family DNA binding protein
MLAMYLSTVTTFPFWPNSSTKWRYSAVSSGSINRLEVDMAAELLRASEAARRLGISTKELLELVHVRKIRFVMVKGIAHVPDDAIEEYRTRAS